MKASPALHNLAFDQIRYQAWSSNRDSMFGAAGASAAMSSAAVTSDAATAVTLNAVTRDASPKNPL